MSKEPPNLEELAKEALHEAGFEAGFSAEVLAEAEQAEETRFGEENAEDLRNLLWFSIDNDDSKDLDQLSCAERDASGRVLLRVAVADVDHHVRKGSAADQRAQKNTTSIYTPPAVFPMLPRRFSEDLTSLNENEDRLAVVAEMTLDSEGEIVESRLVRAWVHNHSKLAYDSVAAWLDGESDPPPQVAASKELAESIRIHDDLTDKMRERRHRFGALDLETIEARASMSGGKVLELKAQKKNQARQIIEDVMIAVNGVSARFLAEHGFPTLRRVVRSPDRWNRIRDVASEHGSTLPPEPDSRALEEFLVMMRKKDPIRFPDLSLTIVKLMGGGEYTVEVPGVEGEGHFGLAIRDYTHSTAPNRRYPDLITQRMLKSAIAGKPNPYSTEELTELAQHCSDREDDANKVERKVRKAAAALYLSDDVGKTFEGIVTGASAKGTWVRIFTPPVEGRIVRGEKNLDVGDRVKVRLARTDVERGFIDFERR